MTRLLFLGFDGMDYDVLIDFMRGNDEAFLNTLSGVLLKLHPEDELLRTGPCWTTIYTGLSMETHDITESWGEPEKFVDFGFPCMWDILNEHGLTVGLFGLPVTYPPKAVQRFWVSGFPTPPPKNPYNEDGVIIAFPSHIQARYLREHIVDIIQTILTENGSLEDWGYPDDDGKIKGRWQDDFYEKMKADENYPLELSRAVSMNQLQTIRKLFTDLPVDVPFIQFSFLDHVGHLRHENRVAIQEKMYFLVNEIVEDLYHFFNPEILVIVSDHGFKDGRHYADAVAYFHGENIYSEYTGSISNMDIMPTLLFLLDIAPPRCDGVIHYGLSKRHHLTEEGKEHIERQLRALGYIE